MVAALARILPVLSSRRRRLDRLARIAAQSERLATALARHADQCDYPAIKPGLSIAAQRESADSRKLRLLVLDRGKWPPLARDQVGAGANHWARISADLAAEVEVVRGLIAAIAEWEGPEPALAQELQTLVAAKEATVSLLRDLALKCDPQALD